MLTESQKPRMSPAATITGVPEEIRQEIVSYLNYEDAWSLKQTSKLFLQIVDIPTIASFLAWPSGSSLGILEEWNLIPDGYEACYFCRRFLHLHHYSRSQRHDTAIRQGAVNFDYKAWKASDHYCLECGVRHDKYRKGVKILTGFGDPGYLDEAVVPCLHCGLIFDFHTVNCAFCLGCIGIARTATEAGLRLASPCQDPCDHGMILDALKAAGTFR